MAQTEKNPPAKWETWVQSLVVKILWGRAWQPIPVFLPGESPWTEETGGLQSMGSQRDGHDWVTQHSTEHRVTQLTYIIDNVNHKNVLKSDKSWSHSVMSDSLWPHELYRFSTGVDSGVLFSKGSSQPRDRTQVSPIAGGFFTVWATREVQEYWSGWSISSPGYLPDPGIELVSCT